MEFGFYIRTSEETFIQCDARRKNTRDAHFHAVRRLATATIRRNTGTSRADPDTLISVIDAAAQFVTLDRVEWTTVRLVVWPPEGAAD